MCTAEDPRAHAAKFTYGTATLGLPRLASLDNRRDYMTAIYYNAPDYVTADLSGHRQRFQSIDASGRVGEIDEGDTSNSYHHQIFDTWDTSTATCRQPDAVVDNNTCAQLREAITGR